MVVKLGDKIMFLKLLQVLNTFEEIVVTCDGKVILVKLLQLPNA